MPRIKVDPIRCVGSARCRATAPHTFKLVEDQARVTNPNGDPIEVVVEAARRCPAGAIAVFGDEGEPLFMPKQ